MANPVPCQACLEVSDADFFVTNRLDTPWPYDQPTVALCFKCFILTGQQMGEAIAAAMKMLDEAGEMPQDGPETTPATEGSIAPPEAVAGILEAVEEDERLGRIPPRQPKRRQRKQTPAPVAVAEPEVPEETEAPDDQG